MSAPTRPEAMAGTDADAPAGARLLDLINANWTTQAIYASG